MTRFLYLLAIALLSGCAVTTPEETSPLPENATLLRPPDVQFEPTPQSIVRRMLVAARVGPDDIVYDLGSGDGRIPIAAVRDFGARGVGIDIDPRRIAESRANAIAAGVADRVTFRNQDLLVADFREATVVTLFLSSELNDKLKPRLLAELRPGTRVVSYHHAIAGWRPRRIVQVGDGHIFLWIVPER